LISPIPDGVLALTIIAWGNGLGDMSSDVAMTKRGFGEMAITATVAGPLFNILVGLGTAQVTSLLRTARPSEAYIKFSLWDEEGELEMDMVLVLTLIYCQIIVLLNFLINAVKNKF
jgi:Ca2+/Na+ antiporter